MAALIAALLAGGAGFVAGHEWAWTRARRMSRDIDGLVASVLAEMPFPSPALRDSAKASHSLGVAAQPPDEGARR